MVVLLQYAISSIKSKSVDNNGVNGTQQTEQSKKEQEEREKMRRNLDGQIFDLNYFKRVKEVKYFVELFNNNNNKSIYTKLNFKDFNN